jgi:hypothetical protein
LIFKYDVSVTQAIECTANKIKYSLEHNGRSLKAKNFSSLFPELSRATGQGKTEDSILRYSFGYKLVRFAAAAVT